MERLSSQADRMAGKSVFGTRACTSRLRHSMKDNQSWWRRARERLARIGVTGSNAVSPACDPALTPLKSVSWRYVEDYRYAFISYLTLLPDACWLSLSFGCCCCCCCWFNRSAGRDSKNWKRIQIVVHRLLRNLSLHRKLKASLQCFILRKWSDPQ